MLVCICLGGPWGLGLAFFLDTDFSFLKAQNPELPWLHCHPRPWQAPGH